MKIGLWPAVIGTESSTPTPPPAQSSLALEWRPARYSSGTLKSHTARKVQTGLYYSCSETLAEQRTPRLHVVRVSLFVTLGDRAWRSGAERTACTVNGQV